MTRPTKRILAQVFLFAFAGLLITLGFSGWKLDEVPAQYVGFLIAFFGLLGCFGVNIWYGGPLDLRKDQPKQAQERWDTPAMAFLANEDVSWGRVWAILSLLLFWVPLLGLVVGALACWLNRRSPRWLYRASQIGFVAAGLIHLALVVMFIVMSKH